MRRRNIVVIGASAGGIEATKALLSYLPANLPASLLIVQHQSSSSEGYLYRVLQSHSLLPVQRVDELLPLCEGQVYVAPPDKHIVLSGDTVVPTGGPRENRARPAINPLFRTAAAQHDSRVVGILLSGMLDDGVAGLHAIQRCSGIIVVQDPEETDFPFMPRNAIKALNVDHILPVKKIAELIVELANTEVSKGNIPQDVKIEAEMNGPQRSEVYELQHIGKLVPAACPDCGGPLWQVGENETAIYRCHVGHGNSALALLQSQSDEIEQSLWAAVRALTERGTTLNKLAESSEQRSPRLAQEFRQQAIETHNRSEQARQFLLSLRANNKDSDLIAEKAEHDRSE